MTNRDYRDILAGLLMVLVGLAAALYAYANYRLGTVTRMGPGMVPLGLSILLVGLGVPVLVAGLMRKGVFPEIRIVTPICIFGAIAVFALMIKPFGLIPAIFGSTIVSSLAEREFAPVRVLASCIALSLMAWIIFILGIGLPIPLLSWRI
jgi:hypothetical protein